MTIKGIAKFALYRGRDSAHRSGCSSSRDRWKRSAAQGRKVERHRHEVARYRCPDSTHDQVDIGEEDVQLIGSQHDNGDPAPRHVRLVLDVLVAGEEYLESCSFGGIQKDTVGQLSPSYAGGMSYIVTDQKA